MGGKLFISYRRDDSAGHAGRVRDRLEREFGADLLFMDVDAVPLGVNFVKVLRDEVTKCDALLAIIGPNWANVLDNNGHRRLDDPNDFVRIEIAAALLRDIPVIPVLLDGAVIPKAENLPVELQELAIRNGLHLHHASFHSDLDRLIAGLRSPLGRSEGSSEQRVGFDTAVRAIAAGAVVQPAPSSGGSWLRSAALALGGAVVLAVAIFAVIAVRKAAVAPSVSSPQAQAMSQPAQQISASPTATPAPHSEEHPGATAPPVVAQAPKPVQSQPEPKSNEVSAAPVQAPPQIEPRAEAPPLPQGVQPAVEPQTMPAAPAVAPEKTAQPPAAALSAGREHAVRPGDSFKDCENCPEMAVVPAGSFVMGSPEGEQGRSADESPQHVVTIARPFAAGKFEVTVAQFGAFVKDTQYDAGTKCLTLEDGKSGVKDGRSWRDPGYPQTGAHPVACVSWKDAEAYLGWLGKKTGKDYRLLSEAEWEYAARATTTQGTGTRYTFGDDDSAMCRYGNVADKTARQTIPGATAWTTYSCSDGYAYAAPVGLFAANAFGLYDVHGNVWEWTEDCYNSSYNGAPADGTPWMSGDCEHRVIRGGMWGSSPSNIRTARRFKDQVVTRTQNIGFRVARAVEP
jgi:formylglycine-generating enzyme required for sulfatase activity